MEQISGIEVDSCSYFRQSIVLRMSAYIPVNGNYAKIVGKIIFTGIFD